MQCKTEKTELGRWFHAEAQLRGAFRQCHSCQIWPAVWECRARDVFTRNLVAQTLTDVRRLVLSREARVRPPEGFHRILEMEVPARINANGATGQVTIWPDPVSRIEDWVRYCKYEISNNNLKALKFLATNPITFNVKPQVDIFERIATPGVGGEFIDELLRGVKSKIPEQRNFLRTTLIEAMYEHEAAGHIRINLDPECMTMESYMQYRKLWSVIVENSDEDYYEILRSFADPGHARDTTLLEPIHELYALVCDEAVWQAFETNDYFDSKVSAFKEAIRLENEDKLAVALFRILMQRSNNDVKVVKKALNGMFGGPPVPFSRLMYEFFGLLSEGEDFDTALVSVRDDAKAFKDGMKLEWPGQMTDEGKAMASTHFTINYNESSLNIAFYSAAENQQAIERVREIILYREAQKLLPVPYDWDIEPFKLQLLQRLESIREGKRMVRDPIYVSSARSAEFGVYWQTAVLEAMERIFVAADSPSVED